MLIKFLARNFKSFKDGFEINMKASAIQDLNYSLKSKATNKRILTSSVIYGPNASGKTTIIEAMQFFKYLLMEGNIEDSQHGTFLLNNKSLVPFAFDSEENPIEFEITFIEKELEFNYGLSFTVGSFDSKVERKIIKEFLKINDKEIFSRSFNNIYVNYAKLKEEFLVKGLNNTDFDNYIAIFNQNLDPKKLFLSTHFATMVSKILYDIIYSWISSKFIVIHSFNKFKFPIKLDNVNVAGLPNIAYNAVKKIGILGTNLTYVKNEDGKVSLMSIFDDGQNKHYLPSEYVESYGTLRFLDIFPFILDSILSGTTLVVDELDTSLHPMVIMSIANIYHDPEINTKHAQLIFNTHNPVFLNNTIFRRDEMCFVEKNAETKISEFYKLSDFQTNSSTPTRSTTDYLKNYFMNKYGAIEYVDLSPIFKEIVDARVANNEKESDK